MGGADAKMFPPPGTVPMSAAVNPVNQVQNAPILAQNTATPSLAALTGGVPATPVAAGTTPTNGANAQTGGGTQWYDIYKRIFNPQQEYMQ